MKKIIYLIIFLFIFNNVCAINHNDSSINNLTIKELGQNIEKLKNETLQLKIKIKEISKEYGELASFIKTNLEQEDLYKIKDEIEKYVKKKDFLESELKNTISISLNTTQIKKNIILHQIEFYKFLLKYVEKTKRDDFIKYIKFKVYTSKEIKDLIEKLMINQNILDKKIIVIKYKIDDHKENLKEEIENISIPIIEKKIKEIDENKEYESINLEEKNNIYNEYILIINKKLYDIENSNLSENHKEIKKSILNKLLTEIKEKIVN